MALQYMEALKDIGASPSTKYILPLELTDIAKHLGNFLDRGMDAGMTVRLGDGDTSEDSDSSS